VLEGGEQEPHGRRDSSRYAARSTAGRSGA
jgi:hypothetical protein